MISEKGDEESTVNLLWTGGWDSTFRLLQIIFEENRKVQPFYIVDLSRKSWRVEIITMHEIKSFLAKQFPDESELINPTIIFDKGDIIFDDEIVKAWNNIKKKRHIGKQYVWLASFIKARGIKNMEISIENRENFQNRNSSLIAHLQEDKITSDEKTIFKYFSLPIKSLTKNDMAKISEEKNWKEILDRTWFCHHPLPNPFNKRTPCGVCNPCRVAVEEGFGHKIPAINRVAGKWVKAIYNSKLFNKLRLAIL